MWFWTSPGTFTLCHDHPCPEQVISLLQQAIAAEKPVVAVVQKDTVLDVMGMSENGSVPGELSIA
jgi:hypothetical protein